MNPNFILFEEQIRSWAEAKTSSDSYYAHQSFIALLNKAEPEDQRSYILRMYDFMLDYEKEAGNLSVYINNKVAKGGHAAKIYEMAAYKKLLVTALILDMHSSMTIFEEENSIVAKIVNAITGEDIDIMADVAAQVADIFFGPAWTQLVLREWSMDTPTSKKLADLIDANLLPHHDTSVKYQDVNLPTDYDA